MAPRLAPREALGWHRERLRCTRAGRLGWHQGWRLRYTLGWRQAGTQVSTRALTGTQGPAPGDALTAPGEAPGHHQERRWGQHQARRWRCELGAGRRTGWHERRSGWHLVNHLHR
jgi:hypothetical protein